MPEVVEFELTDAERVIVQATNGVWEVLPNDKLFNEISPYWSSNNVHGAVDEVLEQAKIYWATKGDHIENLAC